MVSSLFSTYSFYKYFHNRPEKLAPDACPKAKNRKRFDPQKSSALAVINDHASGKYYPES